MLVSVELIPVLWDWGCRHYYVIKPLIISIPQTILVNFSGCYFLILERVRNNNNNIVQSYGIKINSTNPIIMLIT